MFSFVAYYQFRNPENGETQTIALNHLGKDVFVFTAMGTYVFEVSFFKGTQAHDYYQMKWNHFSQLFSK